MGMQFLYSFNAAAAVFSMGEVYHGDPGYTCRYQNAVDGLLNYPMQDLSSDVGSLDPGLILAGGMSSLVYSGRRAAIFSSLLS